MALTVFAAQPVLAASSRVALVTRSPGANKLVECISRTAGPVVDAEHLVEGLEFRISLAGANGAPSVVIVTGLLKPYIGTLMHAHDDDHDAQSAAAAQFYGLLRIHIGTRAWTWRQERESNICNQAADWIESLRSRPILLDRLGSDGEMR